MAAPQAERTTGLWADAWRRLKKNQMAMGGLVVVVVMTLAAILADVISPFDPEVQERWTGALPPGTEHLDLRNEMRFRKGERPNPLEVPESADRLLGDGAEHGLVLEVQEQVISRVAVTIVGGDHIDEVILFPAGGGLRKPRRLELEEHEFLRTAEDRQRLDLRTLAGSGKAPPALRRSTHEPFVVQLERVGRSTAGRYRLEVVFGGDGKVATVERDGKDVGDTLVTVIAPDVVDVLVDGVQQIHQHVLGTDQEGRDSLSRLIHGSRISLLVGITATIVSLLIGVAYGAVSGYAGGRVDAAMMRIVDVAYAIPYMFLVILLLVSFGRSIVNLFIALGAVQWLTMSRIVRGQVLGLKEKEFIDAARTVGTRPAQILVRHLIPNTMGVIVVYTTLTVPAVILQESFLAFLGLTVEWQGRPLESWGALVNTGRNALGNNGENWWLLIWPAAAMSITLFSLNFLGDGLRDALDPQQRGRN